MRLSLAMSKPNLACLQCSDISAVRKVSAIVGEGTSTSSSIGGALAGSGVLGGLGIGKTQTVLSDRLKPPAQPRQTPDAITRIRQGLAGSFAFAFGTVFAFFGLGMLARPRLRRTGV